MPCGAILSSFSRLDLLSLPKWWLVHGFIQTVGAILAIVGLVLAYEGVEDMGMDHWHNWHMQLGLALVVILWLQVFAAVLRPGAFFGSKDGTPHAMWSFAHRIIGIATLILGVVNIFKGMALHEVDTTYRVLFIIAICLWSVGFNSAWLTYHFCAKTEGDVRKTEGDVQDVKFKSYDNDNTKVEASGISEVDTM